MSSLRRSQPLLALALAGLVAWGSAGVASASGDDDQAGQRLPTRGPVGTSDERGVQRPLDLVGGLLFDKPIIEGDFADPYALAEPDSTYVYATNTVDANVPVLKLPKNATSTATYLGDALPTLPGWTAKGRQWAPSVWARDDGTFVLYYATPASTAPAARMCISRATAKEPGGPFTDDSSSAFICPLSQGGAIDPSVYVDKGVPYLLWKADGNCCSLPTTIYSQRLSTDGTDVAAAPTKLIDATQTWQGDLIEGPAMIRQGSRHYLFYSANDWNTTRYAIGVATCESVEGPCRATIDTPWMDSQAFAKGPGGEEFSQAPNGEIWMVHHGWLPDQAGTPDGQRRLYLDRISFHGGDELPTRSGTLAVEEALLEDAGFLALLAGALVGAVMVAGAVWRSRRKNDSQ